MKFSPLYDRVLVTRVKEKEKYGHIWFPDNTREKPLEAEVIAVGPGKFDDGVLVPLQVKAGDRVLVGKYSGVEMEVEDKKYVVLREDEILGRFN